MSRRRSSLYVIAGSGASTAVVALQSLVLIPLYVRQIGERLYGAWLGSGDLLFWITVSDLGIGNLLIQRVGTADAAGDRRSAGAWFVAGVAVISLLSLALGAAGVALSYWVPALYGLRGADARGMQGAFALAAAGMAAILPHSAVYAYARGVQRTALLSATTVLAGVAGFACSLSMALAGWGLTAIAAGVAARGAVLLTGSTAFALAEVRGPLRGHLAWDRAILREIAAAVPATGLAGFAYAVMNQSELLITSLVLGPVAATLLMLNRKAVELIRSVADSITFGSYGAFAHLVGSPGERGRAMDVYRELLSVRTAVAVASGAAFVALNRSFVSVWVGPGHFAGEWLTVLLAVQSLVAGNAFLTNYLYRAGGAVIEGSMLLVLESVARVALMVGACAWLGLAGVPVAGIVTGAVFLAWTHARLRALCAGPGGAGRPLPAGFWVACGAALAGGAVLGSAVMYPRWGYVLAAGTGVAVAALAAVAASNRYLRRYGAGVAARLAPARAS